MAGMAGGGRNYHPSLERQVFNMRNNTKKEEAVCHFADSFKYKCQEKRAAREKRKLFSLLSTA